MLTKPVLTGLIGLKGLVVIMMLTLLTLLAACGGQAGGPTAAAGKVDDRSPRLLTTSIESVSERTEASQCVLVHLNFDAPIALQDGALADLTITLNGEPLNADIFATALTAESADALLLTICPGPKAGSPNTSEDYFAVREGELSVAATTTDNSLPHVVASGGSSSSSGGGGASSSNAVIEGVLNYQIPTGSVIVVTDQVTGNIATGAPAQASFEFVVPPTIRSQSKFSFEPGGDVAFIHNHEFLRYSESTVDLYTEWFVPQLEFVFGQDYNFAVDGARVTVTAKTPIDEQIIKPALRQGVLTVKFSGGGAADCPNG